MFVLASLNVEKCFTIRNSQKREWEKKLVSLMLRFHMQGHLIQIYDNPAINSSFELSGDLIWRVDISPVKSLESDAKPDEIVHAISFCVNNVSCYSSLHFLLLTLSRQPLIFKQKHDFQFEWSSLKRKPGATNVCSTFVWALRNPKYKSLQKISVKASLRTRAFTRKLLF